MEIVTRKIKDLSPADYNPRKLTGESYNLIRRSLEKNGFVVPVVVNINPKRKDVIIGGHQRVKIWDDMGHREVPCVYQDIEDIEVEKELNITLNKAGGEWDEKKLMGWTKDKLIDFGFKASELKFFDPVQVAEIKFSEYLHEEHNYVVLYFDNSIDWQMAKTFFELEPVMAKMESGKAWNKGVARVVDGVKFLKKMADGVL